MKLFSDRYKKKYKGEMGGGISNPYEQKWANPLNQYKDPTKQWQDAQKSSSSTQNMSMATTQSKAPIQGSGYSSAYASNPTNYKPQTAKPYQPTPQVQQQYQAPPAPSATSLTNQYLDSRKDQAFGRAGLLENRRDQNIDVQGQLFQNRQNTLGEIGNIQKQAYDDYVGNIRAGVDLRKGTADRQIQREQEILEENRYYNEQARKERMKGLENTLAGLGTLQSSALGNIGAKINMGAERQATSQQRDFINRVQDINDQLRLVENEAEGLIQQEASNYNQRVASLNEQLKNNPIELQQTVLALQQQTEDNIMNILDSYDNFAYNAQLEMIKAQTPGDIPKIESDLRAEFNKRLDDTGFRETENAYNNIVNSSDTGVGGIQAIYSYMKLLDPTSRITDAEVRLAGERGSLPQKVQLAWNSAVSGQLIPPQVKQQMIDEATMAYQNKLNTFNDYAQYYADLALQQGADPYNVIGGFYPSEITQQQDFNKVNEDLVSQYGG